MLLLLHILLTTIVLLVSLGGVALNVVSLPGNWLMLIAAIALSCYSGFSALSLWVLLIIFGILVAAEVVEFLSTVVGAKAFGASKSATWAALFGGIIGAFVGVPVPLIGSILGAILGSFIGALTVELIKQKGVSKSFVAALGAALGRTAGMIAKISGGLAAWTLLLFTAWSW